MWSFPCSHHFNVKISKSRNLQMRFCFFPSTGSFHPEQNPQSFIFKKPRDLQNSIPGPRSGPRAALWASLLKPLFINSDLFVTLVFSHVSTGSWQFLLYPRLFEKHPAVRLQRWALFYIPVLSERINTRRTQCQNAWPLFHPCISHGPIYAPAFSAYSRFHQKRAPRLAPGIM